MCHATGNLVCHIHKVRKGKSSDQLSLQSRSRNERQVFEGHAGVARPLVSEVDSGRESDRRYLEECMRRPGWFHGVKA